MKKSRKWQFGAEHLRYQQEWIEWHAANRQRFHPLILGTHRRRNCVEVRIAGTNPALIVKISESDLMVNIMAGGEWFDCLLWPDMYPEPAPGGYICPECVGNPANVDKLPVTSKSIAAMRQDHLFEPLLRWCIEDLMPARYIEVSTLGAEVRSARFCHEKDDSQGAHLLGLMSSLKSLDGVPFSASGEWRRGYLPVWLNPLQS